jgi:hypothetical protein
MESRILFPGIQTFCGEVAESACYALSISKISELETGLAFDVILILTECINKGYIRYNWDDPSDNNNFYVVYPDKMLTYLTGIEWSCSHEPADYVAKPGEYIIDRWERAYTGNVSSHFRLPDWDPVQDSLTVKKGKIVSKRVFRKVP